MSAFDSRERARAAFDLRASRHSWKEICDRLGYRSLGAAQTAVNRHVARERRDPTRASIESHKHGIEIRTRALSQRFVAAFTARDDETLIALNREILRNEAELAKIGGMYAPEQLAVTVTQTPAAIIADARTRLLEIVDAEVIEPKEITR
jgi:hypothetical protein